MKHLKTFESYDDNKLKRFIDINDVADYINDILVEIKHMDNLYVLSPLIMVDNTGKLESEIKISSTDSVLYSNKTFKLNEDIIEVIKRCSEYLESVGYKLEVDMQLWYNYTYNEEWMDNDLKANFTDISGLTRYINKKIQYISLIIKRL